jgi:peptide/nickel transport system permease protein
MISFVLRRLGAGVILLIVIPSLAFWLLHLSTGTVARQILGNTATAAQVAAKNQELGLDQPVIVQFGQYLLGLLHGDLGSSWYTSQPVADALAGRVPVTLTLVIGTTIVAAVIATLLGIASAVYRGWLDTLVQIIAIVGFAIPGFWLASVLVLEFAINLHWFPATGWVDFTDSPAGWLSSIALPIASLSVGAIAGTAQQIRGAVIDVLRQDWVRTLRSRGLSSRSIIFKHVLRSSSVSGLTVLALQFVGLLGGAVFAEQIFALPGIGQMVVQATTQADIPFVMGVVLVTTVIVVVVNLVIDIAVGLLNPKARLA